MRTFICAFLVLIFLATINLLKTKGIFPFPQTSLITFVFAFLMVCGIMMAFIKDLEEIIS